jgi:predicted enzyme related to lactoylglutathione lyase
VFCAWQAGDHKGARVVNEHGTLNFNGLGTRDPEAAKAFYGAVFGWGTLTLDGGAVMWTLPGYGDYLEESTPGLRKMIAESGAPEDFIDVVASINPIGADQPDTPPHWSVTFGVDDADEIARRTVELGGKVLAEPFDAPWIRMTVLGDPQGAVFIASKFVPENKDIR